MVHLATSSDGFRTVFFQGHPEYDTISLMKEYKREVLHFNQSVLNNGALNNEKVIQYPPFPDHYLGIYEKAILNEFHLRCDMTRQQNKKLPEFPEALISHNIDNTWHDTAVEVVGNWIGLIYQVTHKDRRLPFMDGINPQNPLGL